MAGLTEEEQRIAERLKAAAAKKAIPALRHIDAAIALLQNKEALTAQRLVEARAELHKALEAEEAVADTESKVTGRARRLLDNLKEMETGGSVFKAISRVIAEEKQDEADLRQVMDHLAEIYNHLQMAQVEGRNRLSDSGLYPPDVVERRIAPELAHLRNYEATLRRLVRHEQQLAAFAEIMAFQSKELDARREELAGRIRKAADEISELSSRRLLTNKGRIKELAQQILREVSNAPRFL